MPAYELSQSNSWRARFWALAPCCYRYCDRLGCGDSAVPEAQVQWVSGLRRQGPAASLRPQSCHVQAPSPGPVQWAAASFTSRPCHFQDGQIATSSEPHFPHL